ncbi:MAG: GNAT family N-acetyltransferase [Promethearchaeota archaeon]
MIIIRKFVKIDAEKASNLIRKTLIKVNSKDYSEKVINNLYNFFRPQTLIDFSKKQNIFVALCNDKIIGIVRLDKNVIYTVFVDPDYHSQGIGSKLVKTVEDLAKKRKYLNVKLGASITAVKFYEKLGYKKTQDMYEDDMGLTYIMIKEL